MKLAEIAAKINAHLKRLEADEGYNVTNPQYGTSPLWNSGSYDAGRYVSIVYVSYQRRSNFSKDRALKYLAWLDAGNKGKHYDAEVPNA
jgi:hypothetical protein